MERGQMFFIVSRILSNYQGARVYALTETSERGVPGSRNFSAEKYPYSGNAYTCATPIL